MKPIKIVILFVAFFSFGFIENGEAKEKREPKPAPEFPFKRFYVDISTGYNFKIGVPGIDGLLNSGANPMITMVVPWDYAAMGKGLRVGATFGYKFNRYVGLEIGGGYIAYPASIFSTLHTGNVPAFKPDESNTMDTHVFYNYTALLSLHSDRGWLSFQTILTPGFARCNPYMKVGISVLFGRLYYENNLDINYYGNSSSPKEDLAEVFYAGKEPFCLVGLTAALGVDYRINTWLSFFAEWQIGVYSSSHFSWLGEKKKQTGNLNIEREVLFSGREDFFGHNHGLNIGLKFQF